MFVVGLLDKRVRWKDCCDRTTTTTTNEKKHTKKVHFSYSESSSKSLSFAKFLPVLESHLNVYSSLRCCVKL